MLEPQTPCTPKSLTQVEIHYQTEVWTPSGFFPHTPLLLPQFILLMLVSFAPAGGFDAALVDRSLELLFKVPVISLGAKP